MKSFLKTILLLLILSSSNGVTPATNSAFKPGQMPEPFANECEAHFSATPNPVEQFTIFFTDQSTGIIDSWNWSFGDGTSSGEQNPVHTYTGPGNYVVCLTILNNDSLNFCYDIFCDTIVIEDTLECIADFDYILDSNSNTPCKFQFYDLSTGNPDFWHWDFGDGSSSSQQNPQHVFHQEGQYKVCLYVANNNLGGCADTICQTISMPQYYNFGGFAFVNDHPINNPYSTGDTGIACLYKIYQNKTVIPLDTNIFIDYGYYHFSNRLPGNYLLKVMLTPLSNNHQNFMPTYYPEYPLWGQAQTLTLDDSNAFNMHVHFKAVVGTDTGPGTISGRIIDDRSLIFDYPYQFMSTTIILAGLDDQPLDYAFIDAGGYFTFRNLALGPYKIFADHTGKFASPVTVEISEAYPVIDTILIKLSTQSVTGIGDRPTEPLFQAGQIFPNPAKDMINLDINVMVNTKVMVQIHDMQGREMAQLNQAFAAGKHRLQIPVSGFSKGVYLVKIQYEPGKYVIARKFIK